MRRSTNRSSTPISTSGLPTGCASTIGRAACSLPYNMPPPIQAESQNLEILRRLTEAEVEFAVVGGVAAVLQGSSLLTVDLDLCVPFTESNLARLLPVLVDLEACFRAHPERPRLTNDPAKFSAFRLLMLQTSLGPLDILREIDGIGDYDAVARASVILDLRSFRCRALGLVGVIAAKRAAGREKDLRALPELEATQRLRAEREAHGEKP